MAQRLEDLHLHRRVGDVVLAADHVGDAERRVVDDGRQRVEIRAVAAHQDGVRQGAAVDAHLPAHEVVQITARCSSLKRQCGRRPSASSRARSSSESASAARS